MHYVNRATKNVFMILNRVSCSQVNINFSGRVKRLKAYLTFSATEYIIKTHFLHLRGVGKLISKCL